MTSFEDYKKDRPKRGQGCPVCGKPTEGRVTIALQEKRKVHDDPKRANPIRYPAIDSNSGSFCEQHAIEVYKAATAALPERPSIQEEENR